MATTVTTTVKSAGGDYTTLAAWEAGQQADIVSADQIQEAECYAMTDTTQVDFDGWTTDATRFIRVRVAAGERHVGIWDTAKYTHAVVDVNSFLVREDHIRLDGLQITITSPTAARNFFQNVGRTAGTLLLSNCIFKGHGNATHQLSLYTVSSGNFATAYLINCLFYDWGAHAGSYLVTTAASDVIHCYNCTGIWASGTTAGFREDSGTMTCTNCYSGGNAAGRDFFGGIAGDFNASADTTADSVFPTGRNSKAVDATNFTNVTGGSEDFRLPLGSGLIGQGTDGPFSAPADYLKDIAGATRTSTWDIGCSEYVAAGGPATTTHWPGGMLGMVA